MFRRRIVVVVVVVDGWRACSKKNFLESTKKLFSQKKISLLDDNKG
jgi:hypothetical protein